MKRTYFKSLCRDILKSLNRFLAILAIIALGVGFLAGLMATTPDMQKSADAYFDNYSLMDLRIISTLGLTDDDIKILEKADDIETVMPAYTYDFLMDSSNNGSYVTRIHSIPGDKSFLINNGELIEGRFPENKSEILIEKRKNFANYLKLNDKLIISSNNNNADDIITNTEFTVVGFIQTPTYLSIERESSKVGNGTINVIGYLPEECFTSNVYTDAYVTVKGAKELNTFSDKYQNLIDTTIDNIEIISTELKEARYQNVKKEAQDELDKNFQEYEKEKEDAYQKLDEAKLELEDAKKKIVEGEQELSDNESQIQDSIIKLESEKNNFNETIENKKSEINNGKQQIAYGRKQLDVLSSNIDNNRDAIEAIRPLSSTNPEIAEKVQEFDSLVAQYESYKAQIDQTEAQLLSAESVLNETIESTLKVFEENEQKIDDAKTALEKGKQQIEESRKKVLDGQKEYDDNKSKADTEFADAYEKLQDAQNEIDEISYPKWYILDRHYNVGYESFYMNTEKVEAIAKVFPVFFFLVATLVSLTTMTRMVEEERIQIGTLKALGYTKSAIAFKYLLYAALASIIGSVIGLLVGFKVFPTVIWNAYDMMFRLPPLITEFNIKFALLSSITAIACTLLATLFACNSSLSENPSRLMLPRVPKSGKRVFLENITPIWNRLKFSHKITARNLIRYKKRFFMTVIGVAGCTALLLTGFGLRDSIGDIILKQFGEIFKYNMTIDLKDDETIEANEKLTNILNDKNLISNYTLISQNEVTVTSKHNDIKTTPVITVFKDPSQIDNFITLRDRKTHKPITLQKNSVIVTEKMAEKLGVGKGDTIIIDNDSSNQATLTITDISENYVYGYIYISEQTYIDIFGISPDYNIIIGNTTESTDEIRDKVSTELLEESYIGGVTFIDLIKVQYTNLLNNIDYIVVVLIICAGLLAFIVLYNLTNINIAERIKEIATLKVLGFYEAEVSAYVYRETVILSLIGALVGLIGGIFLHSFVIKTAEIESMMFGRTIYPLSYVYSFALTVLFTIIVNLSMKKTLRNINMVESMKAND